MELLRRYDFVIPESLDYKEILNRIENIYPDKQVQWSFGDEKSFSISISNKKTGKIEKFLDVDIIKNGQTPMFRISEVLEHLNYENYKHNHNNAIIFKVLEHFNGLLLIRDFKVTYTSQEDGAQFLINYEKESIEYKLLKLFLQSISNQRDLISIMKLCINKREEFEKCFSET